MLTGNGSLTASEEGCQVDVIKGFIFQRMRDRDAADPCSYVVANGVLTQWCMVSEAQSADALDGFETWVISKLIAFNMDDVG